jgi:alkylation response protein AidB-like acyl-CoA dehydrogenase
VSRQSSSCEDHDNRLGEIPGWARELIAAAGPAGEDVATAVGLAREYGARLALPAGGATRSRWAVLSAVARVNVTVARVFEAHTDALAILAEAGRQPAAGTSWGVFAAEAPGARLVAEPTGDGLVALSGTKPWCSLGGVLDAALVTAHVGERRQLFRVDLRAPGVRAEAAEGWVARGLRTVVSVPVHFENVPARPVGDPEWYLRRAGFAWGGIGVAACWHGAALGLGDAVAAAARRKPGDISALHVGTVDTALYASRASLLGAAQDIDDGRVIDPALLALRVRSVVADCAERVLRQAGHALGPAPLAFDPFYAAQAADLELYLRQHHAERDLAALGARLGQDES